MRRRRTRRIVGTLLALLIGAGVSTSQPAAAENRAETRPDAPPTIDGCALFPADNLIGAQYVEFPNAGHGVINFSQCAKDIAAAFIDEPQRDVVPSCVTGLAPRFVLPDEPLGASW